jgi:hypothetical protein
MLKIGVVVSKISHRRLQLQGYCKGHDENEIRGDSSYTNLIVELEAPEPDIETDVVGEGVAAMAVGQGRYQSGLRTKLHSGGWNNETA